MKTPEALAAGRIKLALTRKEAGIALGLSPITIDRLTQRGFLTPSRATRRPLYALSELERFLRETTGTNPQSNPNPFSLATGVSAPEDREEVTTPSKGKLHEVETGARLPHSATRLQKRAERQSPSAHISKRQ